MKVFLETASPEKLAAGRLVVGTFADGTLTPAARAVNEAPVALLTDFLARRVAVRTT